MSGIEGDIIDIKIIVKNPESIYSACDYANAESKSLNRDLEEYILKTIKNYPVNKSARMLINISCGRGTNEVRGIREAVHNHFKYKAVEEEMHLKQLVNQWKVNMFIGVLFLVLCLILVEVFDDFSYIKIMRLAKESLMIISWAALWDPLTFILFERRSIKRDILYFRKLSGIPMVEVEQISKRYTDKNIV